MSACCKNTFSTVNKRTTDSGLFRVGIPVKISKNGNVRPFTDPNIKYDLAHGVLYNTTNCNADEFDLNNKFYEKKLQLNYNFGLVKMPHSQTKAKICGKMELMNLLGTAEMPDLALAKLKTSRDFCIQTLIDLKLTEKNSSLLKVIDKTDFVAFGSMCANGIQLEHQTSMVLLIGALVVTDEIFDSKPVNRNLWLSPKIISSGFQQLTNTLRGKETERNLNPTLIPLQNLFSKIRQDIIIAAKIQNSDESFVIESIISYLHACVWQQLDWLSLIETDTLMAAEDHYLHYRAYSIGFNMALEMSALLKGIVILREVRSDPLFQLLLSKYGLAQGIENDIASFTKELRTGEQENILMVRDKYSTRENADSNFEIISEKLDTCYKWIHQMKKQLLIKYENNKELAKFFATADTVLDSNKRWQFFTQRYFATEECSLTIIL